MWARCGVGAVGQGARARRAPDTAPHAIPPLLHATQEVRLLLSLLVRRHRLRLHYPDVLRRLDRMFPFISPAKGADLVYLEPREVPAPAA